MLYRREVQMSTSRTSAVVVLPTDLSSDLRGVTDDSQAIGTAYIDLAISPLVVGLNA